MVLPMDGYYKNKKIKMDIPNEVNEIIGYIAPIHHLNYHSFVHSMNFYPFCCC